MTSLASIPLPTDIVWTDERDWTSVNQPLSRTLGGRLIVQPSAFSGGRPLTISCHWLTKPTLDALIALRDVPGATMLLTLPDGRVFNTLFRHHEGEPVKAAPVIEYAEYDDEDQFDVTLKLMEI